MFSEILKLLGGGGGGAGGGGGRAAEIMFALEQAQRERAHARGNAEFTARPQHVSGGWSGVGPEPSGKSFFMQGAGALAEAGAPEALLGGLKAIGEGLGDVGGLGILSSHGMANSIREGVIGSRAAIDAQRPPMEYLRNRGSGGATFRGAGRSGIQAQGMEMAPTKDSEGRRDLADYYQRRRAMRGMADEQAMKLRFLSQLFSLGGGAPREVSSSGMHEQLFNNAGRPLPVQLREQQTRQLTPEERFGWMARYL